MTLPVSGQIKLSQVNAEFQNVAGTLLSLGGSKVRGFAKVPTGPIKLSSLYGRSYYTQAQVADWMNANLLNVFRFCQGGDGSNTYAVNGPYNRYTGFSSYTAGFSLGGATIVNTTKFTVIMGVSGCSPSLSSASIAGSGVSIISQATYNNNTEQFTRVLQCEGDFRNLTSATINWNRVSANRGSWASIMVVPGHWDVVAAGIPGSYSHPANTVSFLTAYNGGYDGPLYWLANAGGMNYKQTDSWWYNNGGQGALVNSGSIARTGSFDGAGSVNLLLLNTMTQVQ